MKNHKSAIKVLGVTLLVVILSSCNRGVGCPMEMSVEPVLNLTSLFGLF